MLKCITREEILKKNPQISEEEFEKAREILRKLRSNRIVKAGHSQIIPYGHRRISVGEDDNADSRTVHLGHLRR